MQCIEGFQNGSWMRGFEAFSSPQEVIASKELPKQVVRCGKWEGEQSLLSEKVWKVVSIIVFPIGLFRLATYTTRVALGYLYYPATLILEKEYYEDGRPYFVGELQKQGFGVKRLNLNGLEAYMIAHRDTMSQKDPIWTLRCVGNLDNAGKFMNNILLTNKYAKEKFRKGNYLLVNNPGIGASPGGAHDVNLLGRAQGEGFWFLKHGIKAEKILVDSHSLGTAAVGNMIKQLEEKDPQWSQAVKLSFIFDRGFSRLTDASRGQSGSAIFAFLYKFFGMELDTVESVKKILERKIQTIVVQSYRKTEGEKGYILDPDRTEFFTDAVIHTRANLAGALVRERVQKDLSLTFMGVKRMDHDDNFPLADFEKTLYAKAYEAFTK